MQSVQAKKLRNDALFDMTLSEWRTMLRLYLLPALSMTRSNAAFNVEIWNLLRFYDQTERWGMYGEWALAHTVHPEVKVRHVEVTREVRGILRRVTVNTNNKLSLPLAKLAHSNPCLVFSECVKQAMAYDNLIEAIAESARSLTFLGYDVLIYAILTAFSNSSKPRMKDDGTSVALWLQSMFYICSK
jgi:THO complex subunit 2